ncbi:hypothetical protein, partial [Streptomyces thermolineatus]|uniref:hypothetical protein n=2 Tax=Streptomyces TaxID=1883 RepID=UPI0031D007E3
YSLALTFGTLLSSQGTEASFGTVSPVPPGFPFGVSDSIRSAFAFLSRGFGMLPGELNSRSKRF